MKDVSVYATKGGWVISIMSQTVAGVWIANCSVHPVPESCTDEDLGAHVLRALEESQTGIPHPTDWSEFHQRYMASLGIKNIKKFERDSHLIVVELEDEQITLIPHRHCGPGQGFEALPDKTQLNTIAAKSLGVAIKQCLRRCT